MINCTSGVSVGELLLPREGSYLVSVFSRSDGFCLVKSSGVHQKEGKRRWRLFTTNAAASINAQPSSIMGTSNHPSANVFSSTAARRAVEPAGGWMVLVKIITTVAAAHAKAPAIQRRFSASGFRANNLAIPTPMTEAMSWPRIALRGCARGDSIAEKCSTAPAP